VKNEKISDKTVLGCDNKQGMFEFLLVRMDRSIDRQTNRLFMIVDCLGFLIFQVIQI
jgi:hypothetical protein